MSFNVKPVTLYHMSAKIFPCSKVQYVFLDDVDSIDAGTVNLKPGIYWQSFYAPNAVISESERNTDAGRLVTQRLTHATIAQNSVINKVRRQKMIFMVTLSSGRQFVWGSLDLPVRSKNTSASEGETQLTFERQCFDFEIYS